MRAFGLLSLLSLPLVWCSPTGDFQNVLGGLGDLADLDILSDIAQGAAHAAQVATQRKGALEDTLRKTEQKVEQWVSDGTEFVKQNGLVCK